nr:hypothetical protein [Tanacetum cinerariifolium]
MESQSETTQTVSALKLPALKTEEYDLWSTTMEQYLTFTDHALWEVIVNGDSVSPVASASIGAEGHIPPKIAEQKLARKNELKAKSTLMLAISDEHLLKFHACKDAKSLWEAIKNRFGGNKESKKMQKTILKQNYINFVASSQEGLDKTYDRFQKLISQLKIHGEVISQEDANLNPNETVNTAHSVSAGSSNDQASTASYANDVMFSFFSNQYNALQLDNEDLEQIDTDDLEEMDLKWEVAMLTMRAKRFIKKTGNKLDLNGKETVSFDRTKVECYNYHRRCHFARECRVPRNQGNRNRDAPTRNAPVDTSTTNALVHQVQTLSRESDGGDNQVNDRFKKGEGYHAVPLPYTRNYMPPKADLSFVGLDNSVFKSKVSETITSVSKIKTTISKTSKVSLEKPKTVRSSAPLIVESESDSEDENVFKPKEVKKTVKPSLENIEFVNSRNTTIKNENKAEKPRKFSQSYRATVLTKSGQVPVNAAKQSSHRATTSVSAARRVNTAASRPNVNNIISLKTVDHTLLKDLTMLIHKADSSRSFDSGCSKHMTRNKSYLTYYKKIDGGFVAFGGNAKGGKITRKGKIRTVKLDFKDVYFVKELKFNLFSISQMRDKKNNVLFTDTKCVVVFPNFKPLDESQVLLKVSRNNNMYSFDLKNVIPVGGLTCLFAKATLDESNLWHRRLGRINFKTMNKLVKRNLVKGLPSKLFKNDHTCVTCQKRKQHKASCIENQMDYKVKTIRCDNRTKFNNRIMNEFCKMKGIGREFNVARTPQQNGVVERKNRTLIDAARTMLADSKLPTTFWAEAVNTACYVQNRVLVIKPHNKTPYELFLGRKPALSFMRPFGCLVTFQYTLDQLGKFDEKSDDGFFVGYSINSKAFNIKTRFVEENLHINFLENKSNVARTGPNWMFDIDTLTMSMNNQPGNQTNGNADTKANINAGQAGKKTVPGLQYVLLPLLTFDSQGSKSSEDEVAVAGKKSTEVPRKENEIQDPAKEGVKNDQEKDLRGQEKALRKHYEHEFERFFGQGEATNTNSTNRLNIVSSPVNVVSPSFNAMDPGRERVQRNEFVSMFGQDRDANGNKMFTPVSDDGSSYVNLGRSIHVNAATYLNVDLLTDHLMPDLEDTVDHQDTRIFSGAYDDEIEGAVADFNNLKLTTVVSPIPTTRIQKDHPKDQIIRNPLSAPQTRRMTKTSQEHAMVYRNKKDERGIIVRNKARLVTQGYTHEERVDYDEVFASVARIKEIRLFFAYALIMGFIVYQMDVKSAFMYGTIEEDVYECQPPVFEDPYFPDKVYKVEKALYGLHQASRAWYETLITYLLGNRFRRGIIDKTLFIKKGEGDILLVQVQEKYLAGILKKFDFSSVKTASTPIETNKALLRDEEAEDMDVHLYRTMIGSLIYLKGQPKLGLWYPRDSPFDLEAFSDSDYAGASLDRKSTTGGCQFLGKRLISWQCKKQTVVANSTTKAEYVVAANCYGQATVKVKNVNGEVQIQALVDKKKVIITEASIRGDLRFEDKGGVDCLSNEVIFEQLTLMSEIPNEEGVPIPSNDPLPSGEDRIQLNELMILCTNLQKQVLDLEKAKTAQAVKIFSLKKRVKKLERKKKSRNLGRMIDNIDQYVEITLVDETQGRMNEEEMFRVNDLDGDEVVMDVSAIENVEQSAKVAEKEVNTADPVTTAGEVVTTGGVEVTTAAATLQISKDELTLAQTLIEIKVAKPKAITTAATTVTAAGTRPKEKGIVMQEPSKTPLRKPIISSQKPSQTKDKGKGKMVEPERPLKRKDRIMMDAEVAKNLEAQMQAELEEEERLARLKEEETNIALIKSWDNTQAMMDANYDEKAVEGSEKAEEGSSKRAGIPDDDHVTIEAAPLSSKSPTIVDYKIYKEGRKSYFKIIRADGNSQNYLTFGKMFKNFNREDLEVLWSIVKARFKKTKPVADMDNILFQTLKTMFEHQGRIDGIKRLHDDIRVTTTQLVLLVYKVTTVFNKVYAASSRVTTADRVTTAGWIKIEIA